MELEDRILPYIICFLVGEDLPGEWTKIIGYTNDPDMFSQYKVVILPSGFFDKRIYGTKASLPQLPLQKIQGIPLLFGSPQTERKGDTWIIHADILASTYFLISRYEEMIHRDIRDAHGRFPGKESLPYKAGFIHRPIIDEYRMLLHQWLIQSHIHLPNIKRQIRKIYLTHDVDSPTLYRSWKGLVRSLLDGRGLWNSLKGKFGSLEKDPYYTFPWLFQQDDALQKRIGKERCQSILFIRSGGKNTFDKPHYTLNNKDIQKLIHYARTYDMAIGLHDSYQAGMDPTLIQKEKTNLENHLGKRIYFNRHHFLSSREPEDMDQLEAAGITDDFTLGYADVAGFRLGTCYPVHWINPVTQHLSSALRLHPLTIMDCSLEEKKYMGLDHEQALAYCQNLIGQASQVGGELVLLWHNDSIQEGTNSYLRDLYAQILKELTKD